MYLTELQYLGLGTPSQLLQPDEFQSNEELCLLQMMC